MQIRSERPQDIDAIEQINMAAFGGGTEARLVNRLRQSGVDYLSLVYAQDDKILGHILFTPVTLQGDASLRMMGLAPMAVLPEFQNKGIGKALVMAGLERCREKDYDAVVVLGHPEYYPKFGFIPAAQFNMKSEYDVPDNVFMIKELKNHALSGRHGIIHYHEAFSQE